MRIFNKLVELILNYYGELLSSVYNQSIFHALKIFNSLLFYFISINARAYAHNDTRNWQAYKNWFLNSLLVFFKCKTYK